MKPLIISASLGISGAVIVYPAAVTRVRLAKSDLPRLDHHLGRRLPTKTFILALLLALTAVSGVVGVSQPAAAQGAGSIEAMREAGQQQTLIAQLKPLLALRAILVAEREATAPAVPTQLIDLAGEREAERLVAAQASARAAGNAEIEAQDVALKASVKGLERELTALHQWLAQIAANSSIKSDRLRLLQTAKKGSIAGVTLGEARTAVAEIEERRQAVLVAIAQTEQKLTQAQQDRAKLVRHARSELEQGLLSTEAQISQGVVSLNTSQKVLAVMQQQTGASPPTASAPLAQAPARGVDL